MSMSASFPLLESRLVLQIEILDKGVNIMTIDSLISILETMKKDKDYNGSELVKIDTVHKADITFLESCDRSNCVYIHTD